MPLAPLSDYPEPLPATLQNQGSGYSLRGPKGILYWSYPNSVQVLGMEQPSWQSVSHIAGLLFSGSSIKKVMLMVMLLIMSFFLMSISSPWFLLEASTV